jgi:dTDP-4-amino-4,6-dideoxygalactose transaminase
MGRIGQLAQRFGFRVLEDASHAIGGRYRDEPVGNCRYSAVTVFSFHPVKAITTGEGGIAVTNDATLADRMRRLRSHGITRDPALMTRECEGPWYYEQTALGYNYRMTDIQAALGYSQLQRLDSYVARRRALAERYDRLLADLPIVRPDEHAESATAAHLYVVRVTPPRNRANVFRHMRSEDVGVNVHYIPVHLQPYYRALGYRPGDFPEAERYYAQALSLPLHPRLTETEQDRVVLALRRALE